MSRSWAKGSTTRWRKLRASVLRANLGENKGLCQLDVGKGCQRHGRPCSGICTGRANEVHHALGKEHGDRVEDLVPCCRACNLHVGRPGSISPEPRPVSRW